MLLWLCLNAVFRNTVYGVHAIYILDVMPRNQKDGSRVPLSPLLVFVLSAFRLHFPNKLDYSGTHLTCINGRLNTVHYLQHSRPRGQYETLRSCFCNSLQVTVCRCTGKLHGIIFLILRLMAVAGSQSKTSKHWALKIKIKLVLLKRNTGVIITWRCKYSQLSKCLTYANHLHRRWRSISNKVAVMQIEQLLRRFRVSDYILCYCFPLQGIV
jgi:hypothetical protein